LTLTAVIATCSDRHLHQSVAVNVRTKVGDTMLSFSEAVYEFLTISFAKFSQCLPHLASTYDAAYMLQPRSGVSLTRQWARSQIR